MVTRVRRYSCEVENACNANFKDTMYDIVAKTSDPTTDIVSNSPEEMVRQAYSLGYTGGLLTTFLTPGVGLPPGKNIFNNKYQVLKTSSVILNPGQVHSHKFNRVLNRKIEWTDVIQEQLVESTGSLGYNTVKGLTYGTLFRIEGYAMNDAVDATKVSSGFAKCNVTWRHQTTFYAISNLSRNYSQVANGLDPMQSLSGGARVMNDDSGAATAYAVA